MSGSSPNFDWLKNELHKDEANSGGNDSSTSLADDRDDSSATTGASSKMTTDEPQDSVNSRVEAGADANKPARSSNSEEAVDVPADAAAQAEVSGGEESSLDDLPVVPNPNAPDMDGATVILPHRRPEPVHPAGEVPTVQPVPPTGAVSESAAASPTSPFIESATTSPPVVPPPADDEEVNDTIRIPAASVTRSPALSPIWEKPQSVPESFSAPSAALDKNAAEAAPVSGEPGFPSAELPISSQVAPTSPESSTAEDHAVAEATVHEDLADRDFSELDDSGHTEVLRAEDLGLEKTPWPNFESMTAAARPAQPPVFSPEVTPTIAPSSSKSVTPPAAASGKEGTGGVSSRTLIIVASYASAVTIALAALLVYQNSEAARRQHLESLPDIPPEKVDTLSYVPPNAKLPPGHTLNFGQQQRFGNILVEPLEIVSGPADFVHYSGNLNQRRPSTQPVWKLRLRLTNVSDDQAIAPLDRRLVLRWVTNSKFVNEFTNYFITVNGAQESSAPLVQLFRLPVTSDWDLAGQDLGKTLKPGESYETYLASESDGLDALPENLVWRVQIRKGYSQQGNGVTTVFQVAFKKHEVQAPAS